jgi:hypothetical protein
MPLNTHSSGGLPVDYSEGPGGQQILIYESGGYMSRRAVWWLILSGVFERHPKLKLIITEQFEGWWSPTFNELDSAYRRFGSDTLAARLAGKVDHDGLPRLPSEYAAEHVFQGASFMSRWQAEDARTHGYLGNLLWGRDYPTSREHFSSPTDRRRSRSPGSPCGMLSRRCRRRRGATWPARTWSGSSAWIGTSWAGWRRPLGRRQATSWRRPLRSFPPSTPARTPSEATPGLERTNSSADHA